MKKGFSICITAYKSQLFIKECLDSIYNQTYFNNNNNYEVILGIDGCQETLNYVKTIQNLYPNLRVLMMDSNRGTYVTSNTIFSESKYDYILRFDSDDILFPNAIEELAKYCDKYDCVRFKCQNFNNNKPNEHLSLPILSIGVQLINKQTFLSFGGYQSYKCSGDAEFKHRVSDFISIKNLDIVLFFRRIHTTNLTIAPETSMKSALRKSYHKEFDGKKWKTKESAIIKLERNTFTEITSDIIPTGSISDSFQNILNYIPSLRKRYIKFYKTNTEQIIVSLTSWKKRLSNIPLVLDTIYSQAIQPHKVVLNLSVEEFPLKEEELPQELLEYIEEHNVKLYWIEGKNTKQWKKFIPTLFRYPDDCVICIDDDTIYGSNFIEQLWKKHLKHPNNPITTNKSFKVNNCLQHCGNGTLNKLEYYNGFKGIDLQRIYDNIQSSDTFYTYVLNSTKHPCLPIDGNVSKQSFKAIEPLSTGSKRTIDMSNPKMIWNKIENLIKNKKDNTTNSTTPKVVTHLSDDTMTIATTFGSTTANTPKRQINNTNFSFFFS